jgi:hypothetical protein
MKKLIEALQIFAKYRDLDYPTHCEHDVLHIMGVTLGEVSTEDQARLTELGFFWSEEDGGAWISFRYGSA